MIYTIGYHALTPARLQLIASRLGARVIDVRGGTMRAKSGFGRRQLEALLGEAYEWRGDRLGNRGTNRVTREGIAELKQEDQTKTLLLLCVCESPEGCHRHMQITGPHFPAALHIWRDEVFTSAALQAAIDEGEEAEYETVGCLHDFL
ncbi:hypothetical protein [Bradyrhizobium sp. Leo121]|uniref:hypothetical protein n=1 Tax=Bradyrhizobium sp. Leo121 TaxID=1571195 RepID=UPI001028E846|nr:hypothetical protein [Bradyrhizobium sp. Leo121]RZN30495.1 hypothetical protein CWO90_20375 [Bradyrhizobium sp. Leo121]